MPPSSPPTLLDTAERYLLRAILIAVAVLALLLAFAAWHVRHQTTTSTGTTPPQSTPASTTITLTIDYGDGTQRRFTDLPFTAGMTVLDAMTLARSHVRPLPFEATSSGDHALITSIDSIRNEGAGTNPATSRAWQFWVNTAYGETSAGAAILHPGDRVSWAFRPYGQDRTPPP